MLSGYAISNNSLQREDAGGIDSTRFVFGIDNITVFSLHARGDRLGQFYFAYEGEKELSESFSIMGMFLAGMMINAHDGDHPLGPFIAGFGVSFRQYTTILGLHGWQAGISYIHPSESVIEMYYDYRTKTVLDAVHIHAGLFTSVSKTMELQFGLRFSLTKRWVSHFRYEGEYSAVSITLALVVGL